MCAHMVLGSPEILRGLHLHTQTGLHCLIIQVLNTMSLIPKYSCNGFEFQDYFRIGQCIVYKSSGGKIGDSCD